jgi:hypothetical protein
MFSEGGNQSAESERLLSLPSSNFNFLSQAPSCTRLITSANLPRELKEMSGTHIVPTPEDLQKLYRDKYGAVAKHGWRVRMRHRFGYIDADHYYEAFLDRLVTDGCSSTDTVGYRRMFGKTGGWLRDLRNGAGIYWGSMLATT